MVAGVYPTGQTVEQSAHETTNSKAGTLDLGAQMLWIVLVEHDKACSGKTGCSAAADRKLAAKAQWIALTNPKLRSVAQVIASGIALASITRGR